MTETDRTELEEIKFQNIQEELDAFNKKPNFMPMNYISSLLKRDFDAIIDSFPLHVLRNNNANYMYFLKYANNLFEKDFRIQQIEANFNKDEEKALRNYMIELILMQPIYGGFSKLLLEDFEIGLFYQKDSLITNFLSQLSPKSRKAYENWIKYKMNNYKRSHENMDDLLKKVKDIQWNSKTGKYKYELRYFSKGFLDTAFFYTDSIRQNMANSNVLQSYNKISYYLFNSDVRDRVKRLGEYLQKRIQDTNAVFTYYVENVDLELETYSKRTNNLKVVKLNTITVDSFYKWEVLSALDNTIEIYFNAIKFISYSNKRKYTDKFGYDIYKSYRDSLMTEQDSMMLDRIFTQTGYLQEKEEHSRLFFHTHSYYLFYGDMIVNKSRAFLTGWNVFYLSTTVKLAMITLTLLFFFTTLAKSNLFVSLFIAFFINFSLNLFLNVGQKFQIADQSKQSWVLFSLLFGLICWTIFSLLFRKFKQPIIFQIINIQLLTVLGLLLGVFDAQLLLSILNYLYLYLAFWFILALRFRNYLALPIK